MYRFIEHPSDLKIEGRNKTFEKALEDVANGMFTQMGAGHAKEKDTIEIESKKGTAEDLVVDSLSKIIAECEIVPFTPKRAEVTETGGKSVRIKVFGEKKQPENVIKAVTYHELQIMKEKSGWAIAVLFDI
ncbi:archease [Candidatus Micrarchaeota archaeon]|nr:archease [Candidatus Micrarchaeota archaeon]